MMEEEDNIFTCEGDSEECLHLKKVIYNLHRYEYFALTRLKQCIYQYTALPEHHKKYIPEYLERVPEIRACIRQNQQFLSSCLSPRVEPDSNVELNELDIDHVKSTLKQFVRDWSVQGSKERDECYGPILEILDRTYPASKERHSYKVLVPGAGLGRLAYEIAKLGFSCQGNEFSLYMLFGSQLMLNQSNCINHFTIYPYILSSSNVIYRKDPFQEIHIPDECPQITNSEFSMVGGDFLQVYSKDQGESWDSIVTCFFIDTAHNILEYIERIYILLKKGGIWINMGPLLYHFENSEQSFELCLQDVLDAIEHVGFEFILFESGDTAGSTDKRFKCVPTTYAHNSTSMMQYIYRSAFFIAKKN
jgi:carnosine N-methyltransferase